MMIYIVSADEDFTEPQRLYLKTYVPVNQNLWNFMYIANFIVLQD